MYLHPTWGAAYWSVALIAATVAFLVPESFALVTSHANTLSDFARWQLNEWPNEPLLRHEWQWWGSQTIYLLSVGWLWGHIWYYIWG
jgi:hypothetical protein